MKEKINVQLNTNKVTSKAEIDRLGVKIRNEKDNLNEKTLNSLQDYRTSHKEVLSLIFSMLCRNSKKVNPSSIVTYRIKRFESIIGKLNRYPNMRFSTMGDIGGCRCIFTKDNEVFKLKRLIEKEKDFEISKEYDYISNPQEDGYKSLHLFIKHKQFDKIIEVQIRNQINHNWATLVEITDVLYDTKLKESGDNMDLLRFHFLLSKTNELKMQDKKEISSILQKYNYFEKLSEVFSRNYIKVRRQWFDIESKSDHRFFLIETSKKDVPKILSFKTAIEAEEQYFNVYKSSQNANIVLTHLHNPSYYQISVAYSNYILTFHSFLIECYDILESLIIESLENKKYFEYYRVYNLYLSLVYNHIKNLKSEIKVIQEYSIENANNARKNKHKEREWTNDIKRQVTQRYERSRRLTNKFNKSKPKNLTGKLIVNILSKYVEKRYQNKIKKEVGEN